MSQLQYIRRTYLVPAYRGMRVRYTGGGTPQEGRIVCARGARLGVRFDGEQFTKTLHPTWEIEYLRDPPQSPPHAKYCAAMRPAGKSAECSCAVFDAIDEALAAGDQGRKL